MFFEFVKVIVYLVIFKIFLHKILHFINFFLTLPKVFDCQDVDCSKKKPRCPKVFATRLFLCEDVSVGLVKTRCRSS